MCVGDRFSIGSAVFEVTQPRVTCYKVGIRLEEPRMPALLTGHGRPGFYLRVIEEGEIGAGDAIVKVADGPERLSVKQISDLLYSGEHDGDTLRRALAIPALADGWKHSFRSLLEQVQAGRAGNSGLTGAVPDPPAWSGFRPFTVAAVTPETADVRSLEFEPADGRPLTPHRPGQFTAVRLPDGERAQLLPVRAGRRPPAADLGQARRPRELVPARPRRGRRHAWSWRRRAGRSCSTPATAHRRSSSAPASA